jgi:hypothetical protein
MDFINIITSFLSNVERNIKVLPYKFVKVHPFTQGNEVNNKNDIETGLYYEKDMCHIIIDYSCNEECKWDVGQIL